MESVKSTGLKRMILIPFLWGILFCFARSPIENFLASPATDAESVAVMVVDLNSGKTLHSHNAGKALIPASIMKSVTIASVLNHIGIDYLYRTKLFTEGIVEGGILKGNILIKGSGDPSLNSKSEPRTPDFIKECADAIEKHGITEIRGQIITDVSVFSLPATNPTWEKEDLKHSYGTGCHGLNFENNSVGDKSVADPASIVVNRLTAELTNRGIKILNNEIKNGERTEIFTHESAPLDEIMRSCMMRSDNLFAEAFLRTLAYEKNGVGSTEHGVAIENDFWRKAGLPMDGVTIVDGSGLSRKNRVTAEFMSTMLGYMSPDVDYASFFPLAGQEGTLRRFLANTPLDSYIALKTGSMSGIQCYAGYKLDEEFAPTHSVVIIINNMKGSRSAVQTAAAKLLLEIFGSAETT